MGEGRKKGRKAERAVKHLCFRMGPPAPRRFDLRMGGRQRRVALTCFFTATCFLTATLVLYSHLHSLSPLAHPATRLSRSLRLTTIVPATRSLRLGWAFILCDPARLHIVRGTMALLVKGGADHRTFHTFDMCAAHGPSHWSLPLVPRTHWPRSGPCRCPIVAAAATAPPANASWTWSTCDKPRHGIGKR